MTAPRSDSECRGSLRGSQLVETAIGGTTP
jgi:hypothetical protein